MAKEKIAKRLSEKKCSLLFMPGGDSRTGEPEEAEL